jgi:hypothetical protein
MKCINSFFITICDKAKKLILKSKHYKNNNISLMLNKKGIALVETVAAMAILSFALTGLMVAVQYARTRAMIQYHNKYVILRVDSELQRIKYLNTKNEKNFGPMTPVTFNIPGIRNNKVDVRVKLPVTVRFSRSREYDSSIGPEIEFHKITAIAEWNETIPFLSRKGRIDKRYVELREDYYYERIQ